MFFSDLSQEFVDENMCECDVKREYEVKYCYQVCLKTAINMGLRQTLLIWSGSGKRFFGSTSFGSD